MLQEKLNSGLKPKQIADEIGVSDKTVRKWCHEYSINWKSSITIKEKHPINKPVAMINIDTNEVIQVVMSCETAYRYLGKTSSGHIQRAIKNNGTCYGFKWRFVEIN